MTRTRFLFFPRTAAGRAFRSERNLLRPFVAHTWAEWRWLNYAYARIKRPFGREEKKRATHAGLSALYYGYLHNYYYGGGGGGPTTADAATAVLARVAHVLVADFPGIFYEGVSPAVRRVGRNPPCLHWGPISVCAQKTDGFRRTVSS